MANSKIIFGGEVLIDLTADTITKDKLLEGITAHGADGEKIVGECTFDSDTTDATITVAEMMKGKTAYARGSKLEGTMPNNGAINKTISAKDQVITIEQGYHDGSGTVTIDENEKAKLISSNIRQGVSVLGVEGNMSSTEGVNAQTKEVTPSRTTQTILPDDGYNYISQVTVKAVPYTETDNSAGGITVKIC